MTSADRHTLKADLAAECHGRGILIGQLRTEIAVLKGLVRDQDNAITQLRATRPESASAMRVQRAAGKVTA